MATGMARGAAKRNRRVAFGDGQRIIWDHLSEQIFSGNPNIAPPGSEGNFDLEWIQFYRGNRIYNRQSGDHWVWNYEFHAIPGEIEFTPDELWFADQFPEKLVLIEPNVPPRKTSSANKQWPVERYVDVAMRLKSDGYRTAQFGHDHLGNTLPGALTIKPPSFRHALAVLARAALYIGPEGGLHHGAAAVGTPAVVIFGGFIPPSVTGYAKHANLTGDVTACGSLKRCRHCVEAMVSIRVKHVLAAARDQLDGR